MLTNTRLTTSKVAHQCPGVFKRERRLNTLNIFRARGFSGATAYVHLLKSGVDYRTLHLVQSTTAQKCIPNHPSVQTFAPYIPRHKCRGFTARLDKPSRILTIEGRVPV